MITRFTRLLVKCPIGHDNDAQWTINWTEMTSYCGIHRGVRLRYRANQLFCRHSVGCQSPDDCSKLSFLSCLAKPLLPGGLFMNRATLFAERKRPELRRGADVVSDVSEERNAAAGTGRRQELPGEVGGQRGVAAGEVRGQRGRSRWVGDRFHEAPAPY